MVEYELTGSHLFLYVENIEENKNALRYLNRLKDSTTEYYKSWNTAVFGDSEPRRHAFGFSWLFPEGRIALKKFKKHFGNDLLLTK